MASRDSLYRSHEPWEIGYKRKKNAKKHGSQKHTPIRRGKVSHKGAVFVKPYYQHRHGKSFRVRAYRRRQPR